MDGYKGQRLTFRLWDGQLRQPLLLLHLAVHAGSGLQNLSLLVMPGEWSIGVTFFIFVIFMLFRPTGLFSAAR